MKSGGSLTDVSEGHVASIFRTQEKAKQGTCSMLVSSLAYPSAMNMEVICSFETMVDFRQIHGIISQNIELFIITAVRTKV
jgi:hypothetical protein